MAKSKNMTIEAIVCQYALQEYEERGDLFATLEEMEMIKRDPIGMLGRADSRRILSEYVQYYFDQINSLEIIDWGEQ